jgi:hypothetical protein
MPACNFVSGHFIFVLKLINVCCQQELNCDIKMLNYWSLAGEPHENTFILKPGQKGTKRLTDKSGGLGMYPVCD